MKKVKEESEIRRPFLSVVSSKSDSIVLPGKI